MVIFFQALIVLLWCGYVAGAAVAWIERGRFRRGAASAGAYGLLIAELPVGPAPSESGKAVPFGRAFVRRAPDGTLLFAPVQYYDPQRWMWCLEWFGRGRRTATGTVLEARISVGVLVCSLSWLAMMSTMGALAVFARVYFVGVILLVAAALASLALVRAVRREREIAARILREVSAACR